ncbi:MAG TPA: hypothetical protein GX708_21585 [Gallicola sp.]|nr:hypothetical protein [Gallicola sp.]
MIFDTVVKIFTDILIGITNLIPVINLGATMEGFNSWVIDMFNTINYFIPLPTLLMILGAKIAIRNAWAIQNLLTKIFSFIRG